MKKVCPISCIDSKIPPRHNDCTDTHNRCPIWAKELECETNASVKKYCKLSCGRCNNIVNDNDDRKKDVRLEKKDSSGRADGRKQPVGPWSTLRCAKPST